MLNTLRNSIIKLLAVSLLLLSCQLASATGSSMASLKYQISSSSENDDDYLSQKENVLEKSYHGLIRENETLVEITPLIKVDEEKICNFRILKKPYHEIPFQIELVNNLGILKARRTLNCEKRKSYHFEIMAVFCDGTHSATANVHITVIDINEYAPTFLQPSYVTEVDEGRLYKEIIRVEATDKDCTPLFGDVCKYEILNNDQPFVIDNEGSIKNTDPLSHKASHNHILSVVAYDCAMKESSPIMVSIKVRRVCEARFLGIPERIDYTATTTESLSLFPNARLELCDMYCSNQNLNIHTSVALKTKHISFGCDRDISNCSTGLSLIDLLPRNAEWTKDLSYDEGFEPIFHFDGSTGVIVPDTLLTHHDFSTRSFSIITIFRHSSLATANKHIKEHIICSADDHKMNRHHMALFVRNCRLILLLRKNFNEGDLNIFSPAEWRWKIPQVCDNEWHHYVLNVNQLSKVELYIDGIRFENSVEDRHNNPEVIDDWPLHAAHGVNTTLSVGACYQSSENRLKHGFNGDISEIKISLNTVLSGEDVRCGSNCAEHLLPPPESLLEAGSQVQANAQMNEIYIEGQSKSNVELLLQKIQYLNTKDYPTIGRRNIEVRTTMMCINQSATRLPTIETYIMVNEPSQLVMPGGIADNSAMNVGEFKDKLKTATDTPYSKTSPITSKPGIEQGQHKQANMNSEEKAKIIINGNTNNLVSYPEIKRGVHILDNINITVVNANNKIVPNMQNLDSCSVIVFPSLNPDHEEIQVDGDESLSSTLDIKTNINKDGVEMIGNDAIENYLDVLKALLYSNKKPAYYLNRVFKLACTQLNSEFKSQEFTLTLTVLHPKLAPKTTTAPASIFGGGENPLYGISGVNGGAVGSTSSDNRLFAHAMIHSHDVQEPKVHVHSIIHKAESAHPTMLIILVCVFLVILLCGVSIARLKNNSLKYTERQPCPKIADESLVWDDSALTITINPMQTDAISEDSSDSENSESEDEEVVKGRFANVSQLEWDNSNMFTSAVN
ncbi:calsyntenin-1 isoform X2 [Zeugodacus cucurbitae]|uniref:Calsyntenin-1 n=1 Tax=Zeugodacus cucurbitae TaxID=28588 RepID=A0A0A1WJX3_ZEUCU|nr:calsyntenin-1 isoform X2 [Zeugodacus cucurbitae]